ncbi:MAG: Flp family type IVb pilin [Actinobacteria bacterium]|nr:Flp family type IVb pilin [Actinomycetota bacterium]
MDSLKNMWKRIRDRHEDGELGASLVEYALLIALIAVVCIGAITFIGRSSSSQYSHFGNCWAKAGTNADMSDCH